ncbi:threonine synthase [uncultured Muribaculum sp.]|uniref:threonine synthase n=1 Tax=uncultured Muribaculum sp. TaxID=1918613 RepID=UPI0025E6E50E|nr:threonine synthase [uncultured Muribaculum sp.]
MMYYSTNHSSPDVTLHEAIIHGLAPDRGLYMPERIPAIPKPFFRHISEMTLHEIAYVVANTLFGDEMDSEELRNIVADTLSFDIPLRKVDEHRYVLELFHGPTLAFKDVGARFMAHMLAHFHRKDNSDGDVNVLVATSGDTGSAVANGFLGVPGVKVFVLYPHDKVSPMQEAQFTTLGSNITAIEVDGTFDDCQTLVKSAFTDEELNAAMHLTSANSINVARFLPQMFYYYHAYARMIQEGADPDRIVVAVPSGNFGNLCSALIAKRMGLPIKRFIAANNRNDVFLRYLRTGEYTPSASITTIANAMDVGAPSNFARILDLYSNDHAAIKADISGCSYTDDEIRDTMREVYAATGYTLDPHGATACRALGEQLQPGEKGVFLETAHPAKFKETVEEAIGTRVQVPQRLAAFMRGEKSTVRLSKQFPALKKFLLSRI